MRTIGCLGILILIVIAIWLFATTDMDKMSDEEKAQVLGEKAHRGWNQVKKYAQSAKQGWDKAPPARDSGQDPPR